MSSVVSSRSERSHRRGHVAKSFDELLDEAARASVEGWEFSWLDGRATEERPSWGYQGLLSTRLPVSTAALDVQTGGGEVLAGVGRDRLPRLMVATEGWRPNVVRASKLLGALGAYVVASSDSQPLPFADETFDLVCSRHPVRVNWCEIARVLAPDGRYLAQHVGGGANAELREYFLGPLDESDSRHQANESSGAREAGLEILQCRNERLKLEFFDVGAVAYFLRKVIWTVPDFSIDRCRDRLQTLHDQIERDGSFVSTTSRTLFELRKSA